MSIIIYPVYFYIPKVSDVAEDVSLLGGRGASTFVDKKYFTP